MKKIVFKVLFLATLVLSLASCQKEYIYPSDTYQLQEETVITGNGQTISQWGKFLVVDAVMYVENNETGEKKVYNHFSVGKDTSSLRWGGSQFDIEVIVKNQTTYSFYKPLNYPGYGEFVLNDDTTKHYAVYYTGFNKTIVEHPVHGMTEQLMGGSSRPFSGQILDYNQKLVVVQIQETQASIDGYNCRYWTQLTLKKIEEW
jgi:hypothetical protein